MKEERIMDALGKVNEDYILEASPAFGKKTHRMKKWPAILIAAATLVMMYTTAFALSEDVRNTTITFFARFFETEIQMIPETYPALDTTGFAELSGETVGTVVETDELRIDVMDVISSGNDAMIALRVTAKQMETVLRDNGFDEAALNNYCFGDSTMGSFFENMDSGEFQYIYSDTDSSLKENQLYLLQRVTSLNGFTQGPYTMELGSFGYYNALDPEWDGTITVQYPGPWSFEFYLSGNTEQSRALFIDRDIVVDGKHYTIEKLYLSPLACRVVVVGDTEEEEIPVPGFLTAGFGLNTEDGEVITSDYGKITVGYGTTYHMQISFKVPVDVLEIREINIFGERVSLIK